MRNHLAACQITAQINKMTRFTNNPAAANLHIVNPCISRDETCISGGNNIYSPLAEQKLYLLGKRGKNGD